MALFPSPTNDTTLTLERNGESISLANGSEERNGHEAKWTWGRTNQPLLFDDRRTSSRSSVLPIKNLSGAALGQTTNGQEAVARQDAADMAGLCDGDDEAMTRLMRRHAPRLREVIARMLKDWAEAGDVVDETFIRVHRHCHRFDLQARFTTWLYTIALNLARNRLRHSARQPEIVSLEELSEEELEAQSQVRAREPAPDVDLEHLEFTRHLEDSFAALPQQLREPLQLFAYDELSQIEIGGLLHCSVKAVESRLYHARKQLRADFERFLRPRPDWFSVCPFKPQYNIEIKT
jgi:RNA polymerase sigma factor (sigma-70 family)